MTRVRTRPQAVLVLALALALGACAAPSPRTVDTVSADPADVATDKGAPPDPAVPTTWPLTGIRVDEVADRPAMSIKIENSSLARPQTGLEQADVVWEEMVEGGITRFNAVYHSDVPARVGPIRSLRPMDAAISAPFGGLFVFSGGQPQFVDQVARTGLTMLSNDAGAPGFSRSADRRAPHNVYGDTAAFLREGDRGAPATQFAFARSDAQITASDGAPTSRIGLSFPAASPGWTWEDGPGVWARTEGGDEARTTDGGRITAVNVVVLRVQVRDSGARDPGGAPVPETILTGSGDAVVAVGGRSIEATWTKDEVGSVLELTTADGEEVLLAPGNTWVELLPADGSSLQID